LRSGIFIECVGKLAAKSYELETDNLVTHLVTHLVIVLDFFDIFLPFGGS
jgi:hypothetical protein